MRFGRSGAGSREAMALRTAERLLAVNQGRVRSIARASAAAIAPSLAAFGALIGLGIETLLPPVGTLDPMLLAYSVLAAPAIETAAMLALAALLSRVLPGHARARIVVIALLAALAHALTGSWWQALNAVWPMLVYAALLVLWLRRSAIDALVVTTVVHTLYNAAFVAVGVLGWMALGNS